MSEESDQGLETLGEEIIETSISISIAQETSSEDNVSKSKESFTEEKVSQTKVTQAEKTSNEENVARHQRVRVEKLDASHETLLSPTPRDLAGDLAGVTIDPNRDSKIGKVEDEDFQVKDKVNVRQSGSGSSICSVGSSGSEESQSESRRRREKREKREAEREKEGELANIGEYDEVRAKCVEEDEDDSKSLVSGSSVDSKGQTKTKTLKSGKRKSKKKGDDQRQNESETDQIGRESITTKSGSRKSHREKSFGSLVAKFDDGVVRMDRSAASFKSLYQSLSTLQNVAPKPQHSPFTEEQLEALNEFEGPMTQEQIAAFREKYGPLTQEQEAALEARNRSRMNTLLNQQYHTLSMHKFDEDEGTAFGFGSRDSRVPSDARHHPNTLDRDSGRTTIRTTYKSEFEFEKDMEGVDVKGMRDTAGHYLVKHKIGELFDKFLVALLNEKPDKPADFLYEMARSMNNQRKTVRRFEKRTSSTSGSCPCDQLVKNIEQPNVDLSSES